MSLYKSPKKTHWWLRRKPNLSSTTVFGCCLGSGWGSAMIGWLCWPCWTGKPVIFEGREEQTVSSGSVSAFVLTKFVKLTCFHFITMLVKIVHWQLPYTNNVTMAIGSYCTFMLKNECCIYFDVHACFPETAVWEKMSLQWSWPA